MCIDYLNRGCFRRSCRFLHDLLTCHKYIEVGHCHHVLTCKYLHVRQQDVEEFTKNDVCTPLMKLEIKRYTARITKMKKSSGQGYGDQITCNSCKRPLRSSEFYSTVCNHLYCGSCSNKVIRWKKCFRCQRSHREPLIKLYAI